MKLTEIQNTLKAKCYTSHDLDQYEASTCCGADLLSDVLAFTKANSLLLTGLIHPQVIRTAEMLDLAAVVLVRGKEPNQEMIAMAREKGIPLLSTCHTMFKACGMLYEKGMKY
jgi:predicted transcriptional regulator